MLSRMERLDDPDVARRWCEQERGAGRTLGFVPTMGALHEGHLALVQRAAAENDRAVVSIFVNPLQFDDPRDLAQYPRDLAGDARMLAGAGCAAVFTGTLAQFFPEAPTLDAIALRDPGPSARGLEGAFRAGHCAGVATIVERLFAIVRPDRAYFGAKDFQQALVVSDLARELGRPEIVVCATVREADGLALSSRNRLLAPDERARALALSRGLFAARDAWRAGERDAERLRATVVRELDAADVPHDYVELRDPSRWSEGAPAGRLERAVALVAARVGAVRLIDNLRLDERDAAER